MPHPLIEERLNKERNGWKTEIGFRVPKDWDEDTIAKYAEEYEAKIIWGPTINGHPVIHLLMPVKREPTLLDEVCEMLQKNRELQDKAWAEYEEKKKANG